MQLFVSGINGRVAGHLLRALRERGHSLRVLSPREDVSPGFDGVRGNPMNPESFVSAVARCDAYIHITGAQPRSVRPLFEFHNAELVALRASVWVASAAGVPHFIHLNVADRILELKDYVATHAEGERLIRASGLTGTLFRQWYCVRDPGGNPLDPGDWPVLEVFPSTATALGAVTLAQLIAALTAAVELPPSRLRIVTPGDVSRPLQARVPA